MTINTSLHEHVTLSRRGVSRRGFLRTVSAAAVASGGIGFTAFARLQAEQLRREGRSMILLWMAGGPSQLETFDPKPGNANAGSTEAIRTSVPGVPSDMNVLPGRTASAGPIGRRGRFPDATEDG